MHQEWKIHKNAFSIPSKSVILTRPFLAFPCCGQVSLLHFTMQGITKFVSKIIIYFYWKNYNIFLLHEIMSWLDKQEAMVCCNGVVDHLRPKQSRIENSYHICGSRYLCLLLCGSRTVYCIEFHWFGRQNGIYFLEKCVQKRPLCTCSLGCKVVSPLVRILGGFEFKIQAILNPDLFFYENAMQTFLRACYEQLKLLTCFKFLD